VTYGIRGKQGGELPQSRRGSPACDVQSGADLASFSRRLPLRLQLPGIFFEPLQDLPTFPPTFKNPSHRARQFSGLPSTMGAETQKGAAVKALLSRAHSPDSVERIYGNKIQYKTVLGPPNHVPNAREERRRARVRKEKQRSKALRPKPLSSRQRRKLCLYDVPREGQKYETFEPLHRLWLGYIREALGHDLFNGGEGAGAKLSSADFHGAEVEVSRSGCPSRVGIKGIVIKDTKFTFEIITRKNALRIIPKEGTFFRIEIPAEEEEDGVESTKPSAEGSRSPRSMIFEILGDQFSLRPTDRSNKKFKQHYLPTL
jgi:ribonuclease P protein subunit POP4